MDDTTPTTFVPADDRLFPPLAHSGVWLGVGVVAALLGVVLLVWILHAVPDAAAKRPRSSPSKSLPRRDRRVAASPPSSSSTSASCTT